jgi:hypothetical protein
MTSNEDLDTLMLFNEKVEKLLRGSFRAQASKGVGALVEWKRQTGWDSVYVGPSEESSDAIVLTIRFFIQDNEKISLRNMAELYRRLPVARAEADHCLELRDRLNAFLDRQTNVSIREEGPLTFREVIDLFVYGFLSHANKEKAAIMRDLSATPMFPIAEADFAHILNAMIRTLRRMSSFNRSIIEILKHGEGVQQL